MHTKTAIFFLHTGSLQCVKQLYACILFFFNLCWWKQWVHSSSFWVAWAVLFHNTASHLQVVDESEWFLQKNKQKNEYVLQGPFRMQWQASSADSVYLVSQLLCFHIKTDKDVSCLCTDSIVAEGESLNWRVGGSDRSGRESVSHGHHW